MSSLVIDAIDEEKIFTEKNGLQFAIGFDKHKSKIEPYLDVLSDGKEVP